MLQSRLFRHDPRLQSCAVRDDAHLTIGHAGAPVGSIQMALTALGAPAIAIDELRRATYGPSTAAAVLAYKRQRGVINRSYQQQADGIVGRMTVVRLDDELCALELAGRRVRAHAAMPLADSAPAYALRAALARTLSAAPAGDATRWAVAGPPGGTPARESGPAAAEVLVRHSAQALGSALRQLRTFTKHPRQQLPPDPGGLRERICQTALQANTIGKHFADAPVSSCWGRVRDGRARPVPLPDGPMKTNWCGIYATWLWWLAAQDVVWLDGIGPAPEGGKRVKTSSEIPMLAPGDILVEGWGSTHHVLILAIAVDRSSADVIEGNADIGLPHQTVVRRREYPLPKDGARHWFYSVDSLRVPTLNYGYDIPVPTQGPKKAS